jgi:hypothetical protein
LIAFEPLIIKLLFFISAACETEKRLTKKVKNRKSTRLDMSFPLSITNTPRQFKPTYNLTLYPDKNIFAWQSHDNISVAVVIGNLL